MSNTNESAISRRVRDAMRLPTDLPDMSGKRFEVWIASYCTTMEGVGHLIQALNSVAGLARSRKIQVSITLSITLDVPGGYIIKSHLEREFQPPHKLYVHAEKLVQFRHTCHIYQHHPEVAPDTYVMFLDDDDMLFPNAFDEIVRTGDTGLVGLQLVPGGLIDGGCGVKLDGVVEMVERDWNECGVFDDFSGTVVQYKHLGGFLDDLWGEESDSLSVILDNLIDCRFMNYVESLEGGRVSNDITVFHRVKPQSEWREASGM